MSGTQQRTCPLAIASAGTWTAADQVYLPRKAVRSTGDRLWPTCCHSLELVGMGRLSAHRPRRTGYIPGGSHCLLQLLLPANWGSPARSSRVLLQVDNSWQRFSSLPQRMARKGRHWFQEEQSHAERPLDRAITSLGLIGRWVLYRFWGFAGHPFHSVANG